jgi:thioesterase domain-containing protein
MAEPSAALDALIDRLAALDPGRRRQLNERLLAGRSAPQALVPLPRDGAPLPASFLQERLWLTDQLTPDSTAYLVPVTVRILGELDEKLLCRALETVIGRHEVLRTGLQWADGRVVQIVRDSVPAPFTFVDLSTVEEAKLEADRMLAEDAGRGFDLATAPLLRARLIRCAARDHLLGLFLHHAVTDGWSNGILMRELGSTYAALRAGHPPGLPTVPLQYADAAAWQRTQLSGEREAELLRYWTTRLQGTPELLALPRDRPRPASGPQQAGYHRFAVPREVAGRLTALARDLAATPFMIILAATAAVLARWSGQADIPIGTPLTWRSRPELEQVVGPFVNSVVLRMDLTGSPSMLDLVAQAREVTLGARAHADLPFERLVDKLRPRRNPSYNPLFQVNLALGNFPASRLTLPGAVTRPAPISGDAMAKFDLSCYVSDAGERWDWLIEYNAGLFVPRTVAWLADELVGFLNRAASDPDRPSIPVLSRRGTAPGAGRGPGEPTAPRRRHVLPRTRWEWEIARVWSEVLGVDRVGATDNFFDIGGHSMAGMLVLKQLYDLTGCRISLDTIFRHPTVEALAAVVSAGDVRERPFVVSLRPGGDGAPLFLMHGAIGELGMYFNLVRSFPEGRPVFGVRPHGFFRDGSPGRMSLEEVADRYAEEIERVHPSGPYHLAGFSAAGRTALAVAKSIHARGGRMGAVVLLDTAPFGDVAPDPDLATIMARWFPFAPPATELTGLDEEGQMTTILRAGKQSGDIPPGMDIDGFRDLCRRLEFNARALCGYVHVAYPGKATLFTLPPLSARDIAREWEGLPIGALEVSQVDVGSHLGFTEGPNVPLVARLIAARLRDAETCQGQP